MSNRRRESPGLVKVNAYPNKSRIRLSNRSSSSKLAEEDKEEEKKKYGSKKHKKVARTLDRYFVEGCSKMT